MSSTTAFNVDTSWTLVHSGTGSVALQFGGGEVLEVYLGDAAPVSASPSIKLWGDNSAPKLFSLAGLTDGANLYLRAREGVVPVTVLAY